MALSEATVTLNVHDYVGDDFDYRRTKLSAATNIPDATIHDLTTGETRVGSGKATIAADGSATITVWVPGGVGVSNPASWQTTISLDYADPASTTRVTRSFGPFTITADALLTDLVAEQEVPPEYLTTVTTLLDAYVSDAAGSAADAATSAALAHDISGIAVPDDVVASLLADPASDTRGSANAAYLSSTKIASGPGIDPTGATDSTDAVQALLNAMEAFTSTGGRLVFPHPGNGFYRFDSELTSTVPNLELIGEGGRGQDSTVGFGSTRLHYTGSGTFFTYNPDAASTIFRGPVLRNLMFSGTSDGVCAVWLNRVNNFVMDNVGVSDYTTGTAVTLDGTGSVNQYGTLDNLQASNCLNGVSAMTCNGLRVIGGHFQGLSAGTGFGLRTISGGDTLRVYGTNIQGYQYLVDLQEGRGHELHGLRGEDWDPSAAAVRIATDRAGIYGGSLNNTLAGGTGTAIEVTTAADGTMLAPANITQGVSTPVDDQGTHTSVVSAELGIRNPGLTMFSPPSGGDDSPALQAMVDQLDDAGGGVIWLMVGTYLLHSTLSVPNRVSVRGVHPRLTTLKRVGSLGGDYTVVRMGDPASPLTFDCRLERLAVDADGKELCVEAHGFQEGSGLSYCILSNFTTYGLDVRTNDANWNLDRLEVLPKSTGAQYGIVVRNSAGACSITRCTLGVQGHLDAAIWLYLSGASVKDVHVENCTDGILWDGSAGSAENITGPTSASNVTNLVRMTATSQYVAVKAITKNGATNSVKDDFFSKTITDAYVQRMTMGTDYVAKLAHYGDHLGFYGATPGTKPAVTGSRGGNAALASLLSALAGMGLVTDSSS